MTISEPPSFEGSQPMPAFCVQPNKSPEGRFSSISAVMGIDPCGPGALERTSNIDGSPESRIEDCINPPLREEQEEPTVYRPATGAQAAATPAPAAEHWRLPPA